MNISKIRNFLLNLDISKSCLKYLIDCHGECEHLDYKLLFDISDEKQCVSIVKDIVAMKNIGGGYIVFGVEDKSWKPIGLKEPIPLDTKRLRDVINKYSGLNLEADFATHTITINNEEKSFSVIFVRSSTKIGKLKKPSIYSISKYPHENWGTRNGDIYIRSGDQTKRLDKAEELEELLLNLTTQYDADEIEISKKETSPFQIETGLFRLLPKEYESFVGREGYINKIMQAIEKDPRLWIVNLHGPGGVGKSALASWIAYEYFEQKNVFEAILHLSAKDLELSSDCGMKKLQPSLYSLEDFLSKVLCLFEHQEHCADDIDNQKNLVKQLLCAWKTLIILDNMETVRDGRIMEFVREFPPEIKTKVLLTSRQRSHDWEYPIQVQELDLQETKELLKITCNSLGISIPYEDVSILTRIHKISGGLPLAIQWIIGEYSKTKDLDSILKRVIDPNSPLLEFSFRNSWDVLDDDSKTALSVLSIINTPPTVQLWRAVLNWPIDRVYKVITSLQEATFITERVDQKTGEKVYNALAITLFFAQNELRKKPTLARDAEARYQEYNNRLNLSRQEISQYEDLFSRFEAKTESQKNAILLCRMAEGQIDAFGYDEAEQYYRQALDNEPRSIYALVSFGKFYAKMLNFEEAINLLVKATSYINKSNGFYVYYNFADIYGMNRDWDNKIRYLEEALKFEPNNVMALHALGVAFGQKGQHLKAISVFDKIIAIEFAKPFGPTNSLEYAVRTKVISLRKLHQHSEARDFVQAVTKKLSSNPSNSHLLAKINDITSSFELN